jgi:hypothetical protein
MAKAKTQYQKDYYLKNKEKMKEQSKQWIINNRDKHNKFLRKAMLKRLYRISLEKYNKIFTEQEGKCAICGTHQNELKRKLAVDHNHKTGKVRGLLCYKCNSIIGYSKEDIIILKQTIEYLNKYICINVDS